ncbi:unnamed protein product [Trifolium pratense]|uniref:Uncharacterized protein n=1 Tax=Trifolium pratense TaxID=57577 RepID=A0ACB0IBW9_TRIPR|nr:unnamed protein product [Trifolium pratense]
MHKNNRELRGTKSARLAVITWSIWKHCNMKLWNNVTETKEQILNRADHLLENWRAAKNTQKTNNAAEAETAAVMPESRVELHKQEQAGMRWRYKCNIDPSFSLSQNRVGFGMCICHDEGSFVLAKTM